MPSLSLTLQAGETASPDSYAALGRKTSFGKLRLEMKLLPALLLAFVTVASGCSTIPNSVSADAEVTAQPTKFPFSLEKGGIHYVWWKFTEKKSTSLSIDITIFTMPDNSDGLYFQFYQSYINGVGFYFGLQTDVYKPHLGSTGRGFIFSRWDTDDLSNAKTAENGWTDCSATEEQYIGIRKPYDWKPHRYRLIIGKTETDEIGDWYQVIIRDLDENTEEFLGALRFPHSEESISGIAESGVTWTELYYKGRGSLYLPNWHVSIDGIYTSIAKNPPVSAQSIYSNIKNTDINYEKDTGKIHFIMGPYVERKSKAGILWQN